MSGIEQFYIYTVRANMKRNKETEWTSMLKAFACKGSI